MNRRTDGGLYEVGFLSLPPMVLKLRAHARYMLGAESEKIVCRNRSHHHRWKSSHVVSAEVAGTLRVRMDHQSEAASKEKRCMTWNEKYSPTP